MARDSVKVVLDKERTLVLNMLALERIGGVLGMGDDFDTRELLGRLARKSPKVYVAFLWGMVSASDDGGDFTLEDAKRILTLPRWPLVMDAVVQLTENQKRPSEESQSDEAGDAGPPNADV